MTFPTQPKRPDTDRERAESITLKKLCEHWTGELADCTCDWRDDDAFGAPV